jgi:hypothetical protein
MLAMANQARGCAVSDQLSFAISKPAPEKNPAPDLSEHPAECGLLLRERVYALMGG